MAANDQIERALALADAALARDEDAEAEDVHQHAVANLARRQAVFENRRSAGRWRRASASAVRSSGTPGPLGFRGQLRRRLEAQR